MVRPPSFDSSGLKKGAWSEEEDDILRAYVQQFGHSNWRLLPLLAGLPRCGKSCRLRWENYLKPGIKRGKFSKEEVDLIIKLHAQLGNKWSIIAAKLPGRTDNDIKNHWHAHISKRCKHNGAATKGLKAQMPQEEQSSYGFNHCITTSHQVEPASDNIIAQRSSAENPENIYADLSPIADAYRVAQAQGDFRITEPGDRTCFGQFNIDLPPFPGEKFRDLGFCQSDMFAFSYFSDGGITSWNSSSAESQLGNFWTEQLNGDHTFDMVLWDDMNMYWR